MLMDDSYKKLIEKLKTMTPFTTYIPEVPKMKSQEDYEKYVIPNFIRCGAIPKKDLIVGKTYKGNCRNASKAVWLGDKFEYIRYKWGSNFKEKINHFEDDNGYDLFVPVQLLD